MIVPPDFKNLAVIVCHWGSTVEQVARPGSVVDGDGPALQTFIVVAVAMVQTLVDAPHLPQNPVRRDGHSRQVPKGAVV